MFSLTSLFCAPLGLLLFVFLCPANPALFSGIKGKQIKKKERGQANNALLDLNLSTV